MIPSDMRDRLLPLLLLCAIHASAQQRVLHFTRTSGFDHGTRTVSAAMFQSIATDLGVLVDDDATAAPFSDPVLLAQYDVIIFSNTSGDAILDPVQRANFEQWVAAGGDVLGIHAATDTYRHSTANGSNTGTWDFYAELIGASVQQNPNHVSGTPQYELSHVGTHASTDQLPDPWPKNEEYYYWESGYFGTDNAEVLRVEETVGPNNQVNSYDAARPMSWYRLLPNGTRVFYTALGHAAQNYTTDTLFRTHLADALAWLLDPATALPEPAAPAALSAHHDPLTGALVVNTGTVPDGGMVMLVDLGGRMLRRGTVRSGTARFEVQGLAPGCYVALVEGRGLRVVVGY
jgi:type 1 glutamine amidotransferase